MNPRTASVGWQWSITLMVILLLAYYLGYFRPLADREEAMTAPLDEAQQEINEAARHDAALAGLTPAELLLNQRQLDRTATNLVSARETLTERYSLTGDLYARMSAPFQLIDYQNARLDVVDRVSREAAERKVKLATAVVTGLPQYRYGEIRPGILWGQLAASEAVLRAAIAAGVESIPNVGAPSIIVHRSRVDGRITLLEVPVRITVEGNGNALARFLVSLTTDAAQQKELGWTDEVPRVVVTLTRLLARRMEATPTDKLSLEIEVSTFTRYPEPPGPFE